MSLLNSVQLAALNNAFNTLHGFISVYGAGVIKPEHMDANIRSFTGERIIHGLMEVAKTIDGGNAVFSKYVTLGEFMSNPVSRKLMDDTLEYLKNDPLVPPEPFTDVRTVFDAVSNLTCIVTEGITAYVERCKENVMQTIDTAKKVHDMSIHIK
jgi:hypothetical protein